jgi:DnaJ-class molecular chaperone
MCPVVQTSVCAKCEGVGVIRCLEVVTCPVCHGSGTFLEATCLGCGGVGTVELDDEQLCPCCEGSG